MSECLGDSDRSRPRGGRDLASVSKATSAGAERLQNRSPMECSKVVRNDARESAENVRFAKLHDGFVIEVEILAKNPVGMFPEVGGALEINMTFGHPTGKTQEWNFAEVRMGNLLYEPTAQ